MAITTKADFESNYLVSNGMLGSAENLNKAPIQLKAEIDELISNGGTGTGTDTYVTSGTISGTDLVLTLNDSTTVTIDASTLQSSNTSVYQEWLDQGNTGTFDDFLQTLSDQVDVDFTQVNTDIQTALNTAKTYADTNIAAARAEIDGLILDENDVINVLYDDFAVTDHAGLVSSIKNYAVTGVAEDGSFATTTWVTEQLVNGTIDETSLTAMIESELQTIITETGLASASDLTTLTSTVGDNTSVLKRFAETLTGQSFSSATLESMLTADYSGVISTIQDNQQVYSDDIQALASRTTTLESSLGTAQSDITTTSNTLATATSSIAAIDTKLKASFGDNYGTIESVMGLIATETGVNAINGIELDVNGVIGGYKAINDGTTSQFKINADTFIISDGTNEKTPFAITNGQVLIDTAVIQNLQTSNLAFTPLEEGADITSGTAGGWKLNASSIYSGTSPTTSGYATDGMTLNAAGTLHSKEFYIDATGNAFFKGEIRGKAATFDGKVTDTVNNWEANVIAGGGGPENMADAGLMGYGNAVGIAGTSDGYGVFGTTDSASGFGGYFVNNDTTATTAETASNGAAIWAHNENAGNAIIANSTNGVGINAISLGGGDTGIWAESQDTSEWYNAGGKFRGIIGVYAESSDDSNTHGQFGFYTSANAHIGGATYPFTGAHIGFSTNTIAEGDIVIVTKSYPVNVSQSYVGVTTSTGVNQKAVYGVCNGTQDGLPEYIDTNLHFNDTSYNGGDRTFTPKQELIGSMNDIKANYTYKVNINAIGEGMINVCSENGNIESGDYITTSSIPGKGMKQSDDLLHNYTVAKATESVDWATVQPDANGRKIKMISCTYHCG